jgi:hypothetical protein
MLKKVKPDLFWFLKKDAVLDLDRPGARQMYVQQVLTCGRADDVRELLKDLGAGPLKAVFEDIKCFLPPPVKLFWEDFFVDYNPVPK